MQTKPKYQIKSFKKLIKYAGLTIALFVMIAGNCYGQSITWQRIYDGTYHGFDVAEDICDAGNGYFFIVGTMQRPSSYSSIFVIKINQNGDTIWTKYIDTAYGKAVTSSGDGGCIITGLRDAAFTAKLDSLGKIVWFKKYTGNIIFTGFDLIATSDNGYIICGSAYYDSAIVFKINSIGDLTWLKVYHSGNRKCFRKIISGIDGGFILTGYLNNSANDTTRGLISKIDSVGNILLERTFIVNGNTGVQDIDRNETGYLIAGDTYDGLNFRTFLNRIDININITFSKLFISDDDETTARVKIINNNKYIMSVSRLTNTFPFRYYSRLIITDSLGNISTQKNYDAPGDLNIYSILPANNGDIIFVGLAEYYTFPIEADAYVLRTDSQLNAPPPIGIANINNILPKEFTINNYPNPFNPSTKINYSVPRKSRVKIILYNIQGKEMKTLVDEEKNAGSYEVILMPMNLSSGLYFLTLLAENNLQVTKKIVLLK